MIDLQSGILGVFPRAKINVHFSVSLQKSAPHDKICCQIPNHAKTIFYEAVANGKSSNHSFDYSHVSHYCRCQHILLYGKYSTLGNSSTFTLRSPHVGSLKYIYAIGCESRGESFFDVACATGIEYSQLNALL